MSYQFSGFRSRKAAEEFEAAAKERLGACFFSRYTEIEADCDNWSSAPEDWRDKLEALASQYGGKCTGS